MYEVIGYVPGNPKAIPDGWSLFLDFVVQDELGRISGVRGLSEDSDLFSAYEIMNDPSYTRLTSPKRIDFSRHSLIERADGTISIASKRNTKKRLIIDCLPEYREAA